MKQLSIKDFAKLVNVSTQAIYQRIDKDLKPFVKLVQGKKTISEEALSLFQNKINNQVACKPTPDDYQAEPSTTSDTLKELIGSLQKQLEIKDKQIAEKDEQLKSLTSALLNEQKSAQQAHALHAGTIQQQGLIEANTESKGHGGFFARLLRK